jgi:hypothetical protein
MTILTINGTGGDDTIVITATGTDSGSYTINAARPWPSPALPRSLSTAVPATTS